MLALLDKGSDDRPWPDCFTTRREQLDRKSQNQSYVAWLESLCHGEIETDEDGEDEDHEEEDGDEAGGGDLSEGFIRDEDSHEAGDVDDDESFGGDTGNTSVASATEGLTGNGVIKDVMSGECGIFSYHSQTDLITSFCGTPKPILLEKQLLGDDPNRVVGSIFDITAGSRSRYAGVLKPSDFVDILNKKRFVEDGAPSTIPGAAFPISQDDIERRRIYLSNPNASSILALLATANRLQMPYLRDFVYRFLSADTDMEVVKSSEGLLTYGLSLQLPYIALRRTRSDEEDGRRDKDGQPLRPSRKLQFLDDFSPPSSTALKPYRLYHGHVSVLVTGFDGWRHTTIVLADAIFDRSISAQRENNPSGEYRGQWDPLLRRYRPVDETVEFGPRTLFLQVCQAWFELVKKEHKQNVDILRSIIKKSRWMNNSTNDNDRPSKKSHHALRERAEWVTDVAALLRELKNGLSTIIRTGRNFLATHDVVFTGSHRPHLEAIRRTLASFDGFLGELDDLSAEINIDHRNSLSTDLGMDSNDAAQSQYKTAEFVKILTIITLLFSPVGLASNLLSTQALPQTVIVLGVSLVGWSAILGLVLWVLLRFGWLRQKFAALIRTLTPQLSAKGSADGASSPVAETSAHDSPSSDDGRWPLGRQRWRPPVLFLSRSTELDLEKAEGASHGSA